MDYPRLRRRTVLQTGGAFALTALAGCIGAGPPLPNQTGSAPYAAWITDPNTISTDRHGVFRYGKPSTIASLKEALQDSYESAQGFLPVRPNKMGIDFHEPDTFLLFGGKYSFVGTGSFDTDDLNEALVSNGFTNVSSYQGYEIYDRNTTIAAGISEETVIGSEDGGNLDGPGVVKEIIDTNQDGTTRYVDTDDHFSVLTQRLGDGHLMRGSRVEEHLQTDTQAGRFEACIAEGIRYQFEENTSQSRLVYVFKDASDVDMSAIDEYIEQDHDAYEYLSTAHDVSTFQDGRTAVIEWSTNTNEILP